LAPNAPVLESIHQPTHLYPLVPNKNNEKRTNVRPDTRELKGKRVLAVCGIGNPDAFVATLMRCSVASVELLAFPDHHVYTEADKQRMDTAFQAAAADLIVTTQKDEQKLARFVDNWKLPIVVLAVALVITDGDEMLTDVLLGNSSQPS
jgi:tetraacyldisaccharide 4'-kinase